MAAMLAMLLVRVMAPRLDSSEITHRSTTNNSVPRPAPEGVGSWWWNRDPVRILYGVKKDHNSVRRCLRDAPKSWKLPRTED